MGERVFFIVVVVVVIVVVVERVIRVVLVVGLDTVKNNAQTLVLMEDVVFVVVFVVLSFHHRVFRVLASMACF